MITRNTEWYRSGHVLATVRHPLRGRWLTAGSPVPGQLRAASTCGCAVTKASSLVHVWAVPWRACLLHRDALHRTLSEDERARACRFRRISDRARYIVGRGLLRSVAGMTMGAEPRDVHLDFGERGKPFVPDAGADWGINISHSGDWVLCATGPCEAIGVDVEMMTQVDVRALAPSAFSRWERLVLSQSRAEEQPTLFFKIWSMKEAVIKADGAGVSFGLDRFDVEFRPGYRAAVRRVDGDDASWWHIDTRMVAPSHAAAVAWRHPQRFDVQWHRFLPRSRRNADPWATTDPALQAEVGGASWSSRDCHALRLTK